MTKETEDLFFGAKQNPSASENWVKSHESRYFKTREYLKEIQKDYVTKQEFIYAVLIFGAIINVSTTVLFDILKNGFNFVNVVITGILLVFIPIFYIDLHMIYDKYGPKTYDFVMTFTHSDMEPYLHEEIYNLIIKDYNENGILNFKEHSEKIFDGLKNELRRILMGNPIVTIKEKTTDPYFFGLVPDLVVNNCIFNVLYPTININFHIKTTIVPISLEPGKANGFKIYFRFMFQKPSEPYNESMLDGIYEVSVQRIPQKVTYIVYMIFHRESKILKDKYLKKYKKNI